MRFQVSPRKRAFDRAIQLLDHAVPPGPTVSLVSFPDLDDNVVGLLRSALGRPTWWPWSTTPPGPAGVLTPWRWTCAWCDACRYEVCGCTCGHGSASTHGVFGKRRRGRGKLNVTTWHGELGKTSGMAAGEPREYFDRMYASNSTSLAWRVAEAGVHPESVSITGMPRHEYLLKPRGGLDESVRRIVWAPTYRVARTGLSRAEGSEDRLTGSSTQAVQALEPTLSERNAQLWFRFHPAAGGTVTPSDRVLLGDDESLEKLGMTLYDLLGSSECLITDFSAIWTDYLVRDRPMICALPDGEEYLSQRSMTLEPHELWFPGTFAVTCDELVEQVLAVLDGVDEKREQRRFLASVFHPLKGTDASAAIWHDVEQMGRPR